MANKKNTPPNHPSNALEQMLSAAEQLGGLVSAVGTQVFNKATAAAQENTARAGEVAADSAHAVLSETTQSVGTLLEPIAESPAMDYVAKVPGLGWLTSALGKVNKEKAQADAEKLKAKYPRDTAEALAHRIIVDTALKAGGLGLATNIVPPVALALFAVDLAAVSALQAEMLYRIAAVYGFDVTDPARRGEALTIFALSAGAASAVKAGLSTVEVLPIVGAAVGASTNAGILYSFGGAASQFYQKKREN